MQKKFSSDRIFVNYFLETALSALSFYSIQNLFYSNSRNCLKHAKLRSSRKLTWTSAKCNTKISCSYAIESHYRTSAHIDK